MNADISRSPFVPSRKDVAFPRPRFASMRRWLSSHAGWLKASAAAALLAVTPVAAEAVTFNPVADTDNQSDVPAGTNATLNISAHCTPFLKFDLTSVTGTVTNATLRVYFGGQPATTITVSTTSDDTWVEGGTKPAKGSTITTKALAATGAGYIDFDLTAHTQAKMSGNKIVSVTLNNTISTWTGLNSRQAAANKPELVVTTSGGGGTVLVTGISVSPSSASIQTGTTTALTATVSPANATNPTLQWLTSNASVATVNASGVVSGVAAGSASITAKSTDGSNITSNASTITVTAPSGGTTTLNPVADTDSQSDVPAGTNGTLNISAYCTPFLKFDLNSISGTVTSATLRVYFGGGLTATTVTTSATSNDTWVEGGTKPSLGAAITSQSVNTGPGYISINLTSHVQSKMAGNKIVSVALNNTLGGWTGLNSRQAANNRPELVVVTSGGGFVPVSGISIAPTSASVPTGGTTAITATVNPANATNKTLQWFSSNTGVATVNASGVVSGVAVGQSTVTARSTDGTNITSNGSLISVTGGGGQVQRPSYNTGTGFFVVGNKLYDANGYEFRIRGTNDIGFWRGGTDRNQQRTSMKNMKVNSARLVLANWAADGPSGTDTPTWRQSVAQAFIDKQIVPIPAVWFARNGLEVTCQSGTANLSAAVDDWVGPDSAWVKSMERYIILNIANEWGPANSTVWRDAYITAVQRIRNAGIRATLMIDAGGCGQDRLSIVNHAQAVLNADPQKNIVFAVHVYGAYWNSANMAADMDQMAATGLCIVIGEFSSQPFNQGMGWSPITPQEIIGHAESRGFGWLAWQWYNDSAENVVNGPNNNPQPYPPESNLSPFGVVVKNALLNAQPATVFP